MLEAVPAGWLSWDYEVTDGGDGIAHMDLAQWREKGVITTREGTYHVLREGLASGAFMLKRGDCVLARAEKPSALRRHFVIEHEGGRYELEAAAALGRTFILSDGEAEIGAISPAGLLTRRAVIDLPETLPLPLKLFIIWLVIILWKREAESSS